jgi:hypothetical protein
MRKHDRLTYMRQWTDGFRDNYRQAQQLAEAAR